MESRAGRETTFEVFGSPRLLSRLSGATRTARLALSKGGIAAEDFKIERHFPEVSQRIDAFPAVHIALKIQIEEVFPGLAVDRTGLDLSQIDIAQRKDRQRLKQSPWFVLESEDYRRFSSLR